MHPHTIKNPPIVRRISDGVEFHANKFMLNNPDFEIVEQKETAIPVFVVEKKKPGRPKKEI